MKLTQAQLEQLLSNTHLSEDGRDLYANCPACGKDEFGISLVEENNPYSCFRKKACGITGNAYTLLKLLGKTREYLGEREIDPDGLLPSLIEEKLQEEIQELPLVDPPVGWVRCYHDEYLESREFEEYQYKKFKVGRSRFKRDYVTFLVEMNQRVVGYISRSVKSKEWIDNYNATNDAHYLRYRNSASDFSSMLFGYDEIEKGVVTSVILVEGIFSKIRTDSNLFLDWDPKGDLRCCATFGAKISDEQIRLLKEKGVETIWLWFEADVLEKLKKVAAKLALYFEVNVGYLNGFDPGDIDSFKALDLFENSVSWLEIDQNYI